VKGYEMLGALIHNSSLELGIVRKRAGEESKGEALPLPQGLWRPPTHWAHSRKKRKGLECWEGSYNRFNTGEVVEVIATKQVLPTSVCIV
jgi:hypothetical protein